MKLRILLALALILTSTWLAAGEMPEGQERHILVLARGAQNQVTDLRNTVQHLGGTVEEAGEGWMVVTTPARGLAQVRAHAAVRYVQRVGTATADAGASLATPPAMPTASHGSLTWTSGTYAYDGAGNIVGIGTSSAPGTQGYRTYGYDKLSRLSSATIGPAGGVLEYEYDAYGNRTRYALNASWDTVPVSDTTNRFTDATYDAVGNQTVRGSTTGTYDGFGMLTSYQFAPGNPQTFVYTPNDERLGVLQGTDWTWSLRDANGRVLRQYGSSSTSPSAPWVWVEDFVYRDGLLLGGQRVPEEGGRRHFHLDHLGTPRLVTGATGELISEHELLPFGEERTPIGQHQARGFDREEPHRFTGHERDFETRTPNDSTAYVDYLHARYYEPKTGRFLSVDPSMDIKANLPNPQRWNRYSYVSNNPINKIDPDGRDEFMMEQRLGGVTDDWDGRDRAQALMLGEIGLTFLPGPEDLLIIGLARGAANGLLRLTATKIDDVIDSAELVNNGKSLIKKLPGDEVTANKTFDRVARGSKVTDQGGGKRSVSLRDGRTVGVRPRGKDDPRPTIQVNTPGKRKPTKIRFGDDPDK